jgi:molecular chaperone DnaK
LTGHSRVFPAPHRVIGIDLGTTTCAVALTDGTKSLVLPPVLALVGQNRAGQVVVGRDPGGDDEFAVAGIKRELGTGRPIRFRGRTYQPREICAFILIELKRQAEATAGEPIHDAVITVPASYAEPQRRAIVEAAGLAQLNVRRLLDEPLAAAFAFAAELPGEPGDDRTRRYAIYDLGGGTFDVSIAEIGPGHVTVLAGSGDPYLGGDDLNERIVGYALRQIRERHHVDLSHDEAIRQRIRREAEIRKRELTVADQTTLELPELTATVSATVPLTRRAFEAMIEPDLLATLDCLGAALAAAGLAGVDQVLLVGGSTRLPAIRAALADRLRLDPGDVRADLDPDGLVARGAGLVAREYEPSDGFDGSSTALVSANLRLRAEMVAPDAGPDTSEPAVTTDSGPPDALPAPPAETPADFRPAAQSVYDLLATAPAEEFGALRAGYGAFIAAIEAGAPDLRLAQLGTDLAALRTGADRPA